MLVSAEAPPSLGQIDEVLKTTAQQLSDWERYIRGRFGLDSEFLQAQLQRTQEQARGRLRLKPQKPTITTTIEGEDYRLRVKREGIASDGLINNPRLYNAAFIAPSYSRLLRIGYADWRFSDLRQIDVRNVGEIDGDLTVIFGKRREITKFSHLDQPRMEFSYANGRLTGWNATIAHNIDGDFIYVDYENGNPAEDQELPESLQTPIDPIPYILNGPGKIPGILAK